jgi:ABC-type transporter Mla MlaB component
MPKKTGYTIDCSIDESARLGILKIRGPLTRQRVTELRQAIENCQSRVNYFKINLEKVTAVDLTSIGLLYSTWEAMTQSNKRLFIDGLCPVTFTSAVENVGLSHHRWLCFGR